MPLRLVDGWTIVESAISATLLLSPNQSTLRRLRHLGLAKLVFYPPKILTQCFIEEGVDWFVFQPSDPSWRLSFAAKWGQSFFFATLLSTPTSYWPAALTQSKKTHLRDKYKKLCIFSKYLGGCFFGSRIWFLVNQCSSSVAQQLPFWNLGFPKEELSKWQECPLASPTDNTIHPKICPPPPALLAKSANIAEKSREFADRHQVLRRTEYRVKGPGKWIFVTSRPRGREREAERGAFYFPWEGRCSSWKASLQLSSPVSEKLREWRMSERGKA